MTEKVIQEQETVVLETPITRGQTTIDKVTIRKPRTGELRGVRLVDLANLDVQAMVTVLPRVTAPALTQFEVENLELSDFTEMASKVAIFLVPKKARSDIQ